MSVGGICARVLCGIRWLLGHGGRADRRISRAEDASSLLCGAVDRWWTGVAGFGAGTYQRKRVPTSWWYSDVLHLACHEHFDWRVVLASHIEGASRSIGFDMKRVFTIVAGIILILLGSVVPGGSFLLALGTMLLICASPWFRQCLQFLRTRFARFNKMMTWMENKMGDRIGSVLKLTEPGFESKPGDHGT